MTVDELAKYDGRNGHPAYVAVSGVIYDVSSSAMWKEGNHLDQHQAGRDLTEELKGAPHVRKVVERFPSVGQLELRPEKPTASTGKMIGIIAGVMILLLIGWLALR